MNLLDKIMTFHWLIFLSKRILFSIFISLIALNANASETINICLTGKVQLIFPAYRAAFMNAANLALRESSVRDKIKLRTYFFDNKPLSSVRAYNSMLKDHCSAIIGFEYLSDLLLVAKRQKNNNIPIFTSYASSRELDKIPKNIFIFVPSYDFQAKEMLSFLNKKLGKIANVLIITEVDRIDLLKYKLAYETLLRQSKIKYDQMNLIEGDTKIEDKLNKTIKQKNYDFIFIFSGAIGSAKIINHINDHKKIFIGTENFGSSTYPSVYIRLKDKTVRSFIIRNIDLLKTTPALTSFSESYRKRYSITPSPLSTYTYDAMKIVLKSYEEYHSTNVNDILKLKYRGITGASIKNGEFHRSNEFVILSIKEKGFINAQ